MKSNYIFIYPLFIKLKTNYLFPLCIKKIIDFHFLIIYIFFIFLYYILYY